MTRAALGIGSALVGLLLTPTLWARAGDALTTLDRARRDTAALAAVAAAPAPSPAARPVGAGPIAGNAAVAQQALVDRLRLAAARRGLLVEQIGAEKHATPLVAARIVVTGSESAVMTFARMIESGDPTIRFAAWHLMTDGQGGPLRLEARAVALSGGV